MQVCIPQRQQGPRLAADATGLVWRAATYPNDAITVNKRQRKKGWQRRLASHQWAEQSCRMSDHERCMVCGKSFRHDDLCARRISEVSFCRPAKCDASRNDCR